MYRKYHLLYIITFASLIVMIVDFKKGSIPLALPIAGFIGLLCLLVASVRRSNK